MDWGFVDEVAGGRSQLRRSRCRLAGRPGLPCGGERARCLVGAVTWLEAAVEAGVVSNGGDLKASGGNGGVGRGRTWRVMPGDAGLARRRLRVGEVEEDEELCCAWESGGEQPARGEVTMLSEDVGNAEGGVGARVVCDPDAGSKVVR